MLDLFINYGSLAAGLIATIAGAIMIIRTNLSVALQRIILALFLFFAIDLIGFILSSLKINNVPYYNIMMMIQGGLILQLSWNNISNRLHQTVVWALLLLTLIFCIINITSWQGFYEFNNHSYLAICFTCGVTSYLLLHELFSHPEVPPFKNPWCWFALANMILYIGGIPVWTIYILIPPGNTLLYGLFSIITALFIIWYLLLIAGIVWTQKK